MQSLIEKENSIFDILQRFIDAGLDFIVVGGYAVSAFKHRFSVDADIVIQSKDLAGYESILTKWGFIKATEKNLENIYSSRFIRYKQAIASVDILINALASRSTGASFSFRLLLAHSNKKKIIGIEKAVLARVPSKELLIIMKLHAGRLTDFRDIAALAKGTNLATIKKFLFIGDLKVLQENLDKLKAVVNDKHFIDSFKGVFIEKKFDIDIKQVRQISMLKAPAN